MLDYTANHLLDRVSNKRKRRNEEISSSSDPQTLERSQHSTPSRLITPLQPNALLQHDDPRQSRIVLQPGIQDPSRSSGESPLYTISPSSIDMTEVLMPSSFQSNNGPLTSGQIYQTLLRS